MTKLYYGTFNPESTAYKALIPEWQAAGMEVRPMCLLCACCLVSMKRFAILENMAALQLIMQLR